GYFLEVPPSMADKAMNAPDPDQGPDSRLFIHRQTLVSATRFTTTDLAELDRKISEAAARAQALEEELFAELVALVTQQAEDLRNLAAALAHLDVTLAWAYLASEKNYCCPAITEDTDFAVVKGRHPVVEVAA